MHCYIITHVFSPGCLNKCIYYQQGYDLSIVKTVYNWVCLLGRHGGCYKDLELDSMP
jgi:hypothetical protein